MIIGGLTLALLASAGPAPAASGAQWVSAGKDRESEVFYDPATLTRDGARVQVNTRIVPYPRPGDAPYLLTALVEVDCAHPTSALLSMQEYGEGPTPVRSRTVSSDKVRREIIFANSSAAGLYRAVCPHGAPLRKAPQGPPIVLVKPRN